MAASRRRPSPHVAAGAASRAGRARWWRPWRMWPRTSYSTWRATASWCAETPSGGFGAASACPSRDAAHPRADAGGGGPPAQAAQVMPSARETYPVAEPTPDTDLGTSACCRARSTRTRPAEHGAVRARPSESKWLAVVAHHRHRRSSVRPGVASRRCAATATLGPDRGCGRSTLMVSGGNLDASRRTQTIAIRLPCSRDVYWPKAEATRCQLFA